MSRRRYLSTDISLDKEVNRLAMDAGDFTTLLYTWMIPHAEDDARIGADPEELMALVIPMRRDKTVGDVEAALTAMVDRGLIIWGWDDRGKLVAEFPPEAFYKRQAYIPADKRRYETTIINQRTLATIGDNRRELAKISASPSPSPSPSLTPTPSPKRRPAQSVGYTVEFEEFWMEYPRREAKSTAFRAWKARMNDKVDPDDLIFAAKAYSRDCQAENREAKFIKLPATFLGPDKHYEKYLTDDVREFMAMMDRLGKEGAK